MVLVSVSTLAVAGVIGVSAGAAGADPIPGATYVGTASDGASITFTVSSDGTLIDSYLITGAHGFYAGMSDQVTCEFFAGGDSGVWAGAPLAGGSFSYTLGQTTFSGSFPGAQSASGTFDLNLPAAESFPSCDSGSVSWTATTTATPPPGGSGGGGGGASGGGSPGGGGAGSGGGSTAGGSPLPSTSPKLVTERLTLARLRGDTFGGRIHTTGAACVARRTVYLWRGKRRIAHTKTNARGQYSFKVKGAGRKGLRVSVPAVHIAGVTCGAASSVYIG
jgi:hypothetical protein